jgi:hypothetical protein
MKAFFGWLLIAAGGLIAVTCGLCTLSFAGIMISGNLSALPGSLGLCLMFGGPPIALGVGLILIGRSLVRKPPVEDG